MQLANNLLSDAALRQRRDELLRAAMSIDAQLRRVGELLWSRENPGARRPKHGTTRMWRAGCPCRACRAAKAAEVARYREKVPSQRRGHPARGKERTMKTTKPGPHDTIAHPQTRLMPGVRGMVYGVCEHCSWEEGPSVKTYIEERRVEHRRAHRAGLIEVTR